MTIENDALVLIFERNAFYRRLHFLALAAYLLSLIVNAVLLSVVYFLLKNPTKPIYFATDNVSRLMDVIPVDRPNMTTEEVTAWAVESVQAALSYDYINYHRQFQAAQKYFTNYGWVNYMKTYQYNNNLNALRERRLIVLAQVVDAPKLLAQGILSGAYAWKFQMPLLMNFWGPPYDDKSKILNAWTVTVIIQRQPILQSYKGLGIVQLVASPSTQSQTMTNPSAG